MLVISICWLFDMLIIWYVVYLICWLFDMLFICYVIGLLCWLFVMLTSLIWSFYVMSLVCYTDYFVMSFVWYVSYLLCILFDMAFICYARYLLCLLFIFFVMLRNTLICTSKFICYPASWRVLWYAGSIYGMIVSHTVSILYSSHQFVLYERNLHVH